jgi:hypothetical protein
MKERFKRPKQTTEVLLLDMEAEGLLAVVGIFKTHVSTL